MAQADNLAVLYRNWIDDGTVSASSEATPAERVQEMRPSRRWVATGATAEWIAGDIGEEVDVDRLAVLAHNFDTSTEVRARLSTEADGFEEYTPALTAVATALGLPSYVTFTRASAGTYVAADGAVRTAATNVPRWHYDSTSGEYWLLIEPSRTTLVTWSRRLDDAAWTKTNVTASVTAGADNVAGSGTRLTATADGGTVLQANTSASTARRFAPFVKRISGAGAVEITLDGGATWTAVIPTASWARYGIGQTLANPSVGFRLGTSGDVIDVDFAGGENGTFDTAPIESTAAVATRAGDVFTIPDLSDIGFNATEGSLLVEVTIPGLPSSGSRVIARYDDGSQNNRIQQYFTSGGTLGHFVRAASTTYADFGSGTISANALSRCATAFKVDDIAGCLNGGAVATDTSATLPSGLTTFRLGHSPGGGDQPGGRYRRAIGYSRRLTNDELQAWSSTGTLPAGAAWVLDLTACNPVTVTGIAAATYDAMVTAVLADGSTRKRWLDLVVSGGAGTVDPALDEASITQVEVFTDSLTADQQDRYADTGSTQSVTYDSTQDAWQPVAGFGEDGFGASLGGYPILSAINDWRPYTVFALAASVRARYWRFDISRSGGNSLGNFRVGRVMAGLVLQSGRNIGYEWDLEWVDPSDILDTEASFLVNRRDKYRLLRIVWPALTEAEALGVMDDFSRTVGRSRDVLIEIFPTATSTKRNRTIVHGVPTRNGPTRNPHYDIYDKSLELRELRE